MKNSVLRVPPDKWIVVCPTCKRTDTAQMKHIHRYMRIGWPRCCGVLMMVSEVSPPRRSAEISPVV